MGVTILEISGGNVSLTRGSGSFNRSRRDKRKSTLALPYVRCLAFLDADGWYGALYKMLVGGCEGASKLPPVC